MASEPAPGSHGDRPPKWSQLPGSGTSYPRGTLEFERFALFSDAVFAIALTLLVVGIAVPTVSDVSDASEMWDVLFDLRPEFVSFFVGFAVIGRYWLAHHRFVGVLAAVDGRLLAWNLVYLALIAFAPFPTALVGRYEENLVAFAFYAVTLALLSLLETVFFVVARRRRLLQFVIPRRRKARPRRIARPGRRLPALGADRVRHELDDRPRLLGLHLATGGARRPSLARDGRPAAELAGAE